jgi:hypothetical protein
MANTLQQHALFLNMMAERLDEMQASMREDWPAFAAWMCDMTARVTAAATDQEAVGAVQQIIDRGLASPAAPLFQKMLAQAKARADMAASFSTTITLPPRQVLDNAAAQLNDRVAPFAQQTWPASPPPPPPPPPPSPPPLPATGGGGEEGLEAFIPEEAEESGGHRGVEELDKASGGGEAAEPEPGVTHAEPPAQDDPARRARFLNAAFFPKDSDAQVPVEQPLHLTGQWRLGVNVGAFTGPGKAGPAIDGALMYAFEEQSVLDMVVAVRSRSVKVTPSFQPLELPRTGNSDFVYFDLGFGRADRHVLTVDLFYTGHLIQSRRVEVEVVKTEGAAAPVGRIPQDGRDIFSRATCLVKEDLSPLEDNPRRLTITSDRDEGVIELVFFDLARGNLGSRETKLSEANLNTLLDNTRKAMQDVTGAYKVTVGGSLEDLRVSLWQLATEGFEFYRALLPWHYDPDGEGPGMSPIELGLQYGQTIQVAPLSNLAGVPWELLYDRRIEKYRKDSDRVQLCPEFMTHQPGECPNADNPRIVCPYGFWGFRYIIEQLPNRVPPDQPLPATQLPLVVRNGDPLRFAALVFAFKELEDHIKALGDLKARLDLTRVNNLDGVETILTQADQVPDILYFYAHGGFDKKAPTLTLGDPKSKVELTVDDLSAWKIDLSQRNPLVVINACESVSYSPDHVESLLEEFVKRGASGIVGTQVQVTPALAQAFMLPFLRAFLTDKSLGNSLFDARRTLLMRHETINGDSVHRPDPRGLVYSLFAACDVELALPVLEDTAASGGR